MKKVDKIKDRIIFLRKKAGLTQTELADRLGVTQSTVSQWENGPALPETAKIPRLAMALNCSVSELFSDGKLVDKS